LHVANSLDELAAKTGINAEGLKATVVQYNDFCDHGYDEIFLKPSVIFARSRRDRTTR